MHASASNHRPVLGIALKLGSIVMFSGMTLCVKLLGTDVPTGQSMFVRGIISIVVLALIAWRTEGLHLLKTRNPAAHALRSLTGTVSMFLLFTSVTLLPLADATAIQFTSPMFVTLLAMLFLGERIHRFRWTALGVGFLGVLIMVGPYLSYSGGASLGVFAAMGNAVFSAVAMIFLRRMSGGEHAITITFYFAVTFAACAALTAFFGWASLDAWQWLIIVVAGLFGVFGQLLMTYSYRFAEASTIAPLDYSNMLMAIMLGYLFFGDIPSVTIWIGSLLVISAGLIILWREYTLKKQLSVPVPEATV